MPQPSSSPDRGSLRLGLPVWAHAPWRGSLFSANAGRDDFLPQYARVFQAVEGNSSFYAEPSPALVARWRAQAPAGFKFSFKFPRRITHDAQLRGVNAEIGAFLTRMAPLEDRLGAFMIQLGPRFDRSALPDLRRTLQQLPTAFSYAVEVRHRDFYLDASAAIELDQMLGESGVDRAIFDTRILHAAQPTDTSTREAQSRKPRLPFCVNRSGAHPLLRLVGSNRIEEAHTVIEQWAGQLNQWLLQGLAPTVFCHTPDDLHAPQLARLLHSRLRELHPALPPLAEFPDPAPDSNEPRQLTLF